jgi:hypothetical protein
MTIAAKKRTPARRPVMVSTLAAKLLGHSRTSGLAGFSAHHLTIAFPAFNALELAHALDELLNKKLLQQKGSNERATFSLTDYGREGRVAVA